MSARPRGEEGSALVLALVMVVSFGLVALAAGRYATTNMADTVVTRDRTRALEAAAGGARVAIATIEADPAGTCTSPGPAAVAVPVLNGLTPTVTCTNVASLGGRSVVVESSAGSRDVRAEVAVGVGSPPPVALTAWVTDAP